MAYQRIVIITRQKKNRQQRTQPGSYFQRWLGKGSFAQSSDKHWCLHLSFLATFFITEKKLSPPDSEFTKIIWMLTLGWHLFLSMYCDEILGHNDSKAVPETLIECMLVSAPRGASVIHNYLELNHQLWQTAILKTISRYLSPPRFRSRNTTIQREINRSF